MTTTPKRRWYQFSLKAMLVVMLLVEPLCAWVWKTWESRFIRIPDGGTVLVGKNRIRPTP